MSFEKVSYTVELLKKYGGSFKSYIPEQRINMFHEIIRWFLLQSKEMIIAEKENACASDKGIQFKKKLSYTYGESSRGRTHTELLFNNHERLEHMSSIGA
jgi:hypothetical protein